MLRKLIFFTFAIVAAGGGVIASTLGRNSYD